MAPSLIVLLLWSFCFNENVDALWSDYWSERLCHPLIAKHANASNARISTIDITENELREYNLTKSHFLFCYGQPINIHLNNESDDSWSDLFKMKKSEWNMNFIDSAPVRGGIIGILRIGINQSMNINKMPLSWDGNEGVSSYFIKPFVGMMDAEWFILTAGGNWFRTFSRNFKTVRFEDSSPYRQQGWLFTSVHSVFWGKGTLILDECGYLSLRLMTCDYGEIRDLQTHFRDGTFRFFTAGQAGQWQMSLE